MTNPLASHSVYCGPVIWQQVVAKLPDKLNWVLPTVEDIEQEFQQLQGEQGE